MGRQCRRLLFRVIIGIPIVWFSVVGFMVVMSGGGIPSPHAYPRNMHQQTGPAAQGQPVIERPNFDQLRFQQRMQEDARLEIARLDAKRRIQKEMVVSITTRTPAMHIEQDKEPSVDRAPPDAPGEQGRAVSIDKEKLSAAERAKFEEGWNHNAFNEYASNMISLHRSLPDVRDVECLDIKYHTVLPDTSVIVVFHNEAWSVLLRTVYSVLDRTPAKLLKEIILVDDASTFDHLHKRLDDYVAIKFKKVKVVRAPQREGLIRARLLGASVATGDVLTFLDSHCEATKGWLEPLLDRIAQNWSNVVTPVIDVIEDGTFKFLYGSAKTTSVGGFDWNLQFNWHGIPEEERLRRETPVSPIRSPTMAGGLFSIDRKYFNHIGTYDRGMEIWGGENLEMSFRVWMCGGTLEIIPCSHVGHIFRKRSPYSWKSGVNVVKKNSVRLAEVWLDDYKKYYYERYNNNLGEYGDVSERKALRKRLQCKTFDWYIKNIYPSLFIPGEAMASGEIQNEVEAQCLDSPVDKNAHNKPVKLWPCHKQGGNQYWMLSKEGEIRRDEACMDFAGQFLMIYPCHGMKGNQHWEYTKSNELRHYHSGLCIELTKDQKIKMKTCDGSTRQKWLWHRQIPDSEKKKRAGGAR
ncbi:hypothetical protein NP493_249g00008 [Ridgeia piscesae]|uniref:Polypeptide N-acetylgalactosaminyltransferase n=1 Tax=Ridgeia piscesae TaxID=27915 RepID=A0AAD9NYP0_RIDPI|nr:hypothetical protein NP493_249g00008 [Ridgeia piscesae]